MDVPKIAKWHLVHSWEFPNGLVIKDSGFHCRGVGVIPGQGTKISHASVQKKKKKRWYIQRVKGEEVNTLMGTELPKSERGGSKDIDGY